MEITKQNLKIVTGVMALLLVLTSAGCIYFWDKSKDLSLENTALEQDTQRMRNQLLASNQNIDQLNNRLATSEKGSKELSVRIKELNNSLNQKSAELWDMDARSAASRKALRNSMQTQLAEVANQTEQLTNDNQLLTEQNNTLNNQIVSLNDKIATMVPRSTLTADGFFVEAVKQNNKETAKAKKVHTLTISFNIPPELGLTGKEEVYLSLTDLQGNVMSTPLRTLTTAASGENKTVPVNAVKEVDFSKNLQRVAFTLDSTDDIKPGTYRASVYTKDNYLGVVEFRFRDSFWFF